jgi:cation:H+ antiporter
MNDYLALGLGTACAGLGGEFFIRGTVGLARWLRVSAGIIGVTVTAFATSSPELSVAISSALSGIPRIALGDALGSNVVNIALILGLALIAGRIRSQRKDIKRDYWAAVLSPLVIGVLAIDGVLSRVDGLLLLTAFTAWLIHVTVVARRQRSAAGEVLGEQREWLAIAYGAMGLGLLIMAGRLIVSGASGLAAAMGIGSFIVGAVIVAFGTSVPELATVVISRIRGHDEIGLNTVLGSNIFNGLWVIGVAATICPIAFARWEVMAVLTFGIVTVGMTLPSRNGYVERWRGVVLLVLYGVFVFTTIR